jgi:hypothetical protein
MVHWLYVEFWWAVHNLVAHPLSQVMWWLSLCGVIKTVARASEWVHDWTVPVHTPEEGRG